MNRADPLRVLVLIDSLGQGGAEHSLAATLPRMVSGGVIAEIVCRNRAEGQLAADLRSAGVPVTVLPDPSPVATLRWLRRRLRSDPPDVIHLNLFVPTTIGSIAAIGSDVPVIVSIVNTTATSDPAIATWKLRTVTALEGLVCRRGCALVHAVTEGVADVVRRDLRVPLDKIKVAERGRDGGRFRPARNDERGAMLRSLDIAENAEVVIAVGRHVHQKGFDVLLDAIATLQAERPGLVMLIAGRDGPESESLRTQVTSLSRPDDVRILGDRTDVEALLRAADVYVMSSRREGAAGAMLEAMATALPIVATDLEGTSGVLHHERHALLVPVEQPVELGDAITKLLDDRPFACALGTNAHSEFSERFGLDVAVDSLAEVYRSGAAARGASWRTVLFGRGAQTD